MLSIIIPAYNEENRLGPTLQDYLLFFKKNTEIIVVNDGSKDNTSRLVAELVKKHDNLRLINQENTGKGEDTTNDGDGDNGDKDNDNTGDA